MNPDSEGIRATERDEHNSDAHAKRVVVRYFNAETGSWQNFDPNESFTERYDYDNIPIYVGQAEIGTVDSALGWTITQFDLTDPSNATGKVATDVSWTDRATGTYL